MILTRIRGALLKRFKTEKFLENSAGDNDLTWLYSRACLSGFDSGLDPVRDERFHDALRSELAAIAMDMRKEVLSKRSMTGS